MAKHLTIEQLEHEIERIAHYITEAKREIAAIAPSHGNTTLTNDSSEKNVANATLQLSEVVRHTEEATNTIMDNVDAIMALSGTVADAALGGKISTHGMNILEACSFQDITGQRIKKVMTTLEQIELRVGRLVKLFGGDMPDTFHGEPIDNGTAKRADEALCNGPQLSKDKPSQDDIDKLFSST